MGSGAVSVKYNCGPGHYFPRKIIKNSGIWAFGSPGQYFPQKIKKLWVLEELCPMIMLCSGALFGQSLFNDKNQVKAKINAFRFASFFFRRVSTSTVYDIDR